MTQPTGSAATAPAPVASSHRPERRGRDPVTAAGPGDGDTEAAGHPAGAASPDHPGDRGRTGLRGHGSGDLPAADLRPAARRVLDRPADPGPADPDQPAARRRQRHQRVPGRRSRERRPAQGVRRRDHRVLPADRRGRGCGAGRPGRSLRAERPADRLHREHRAGTSQQPAGFPGRGPVPAQRQRRSAGRRDADPGQPGDVQRRPGRESDERPDRDPVRGGRAGRARSPGLGAGRSRPSLQAAVQRRPGGRL